MTEAETKFEISSEAISQVIFPKGVAEPKEENLLSSEEIPSWLNEVFIENVLRSFYDDEDLKVRCLKIQQCGGKGDSYASVMFRVGTYFSEGKNLKSIKFRSYIVKTLPVADIAMEKLGANNYNVQDKEMDMYKKVLPEFKTLLKSINEDADIFPTCLAVDKDLDVIVLEDLAEKNFVMADRTKGLDQDHILMALRKMARMHAASAVVYSKDPESISSFDTGFFTRKTDAFHVMFETLCEGLIEEMASWEGFEYYAKKLPNVRKSLVKTARRAFDCDEGDFHVLTHGDLWTNNLMYRYNESGNPIDSVLLDFQFTCYGSPALDLIVSRVTFNFKSLTDFFFLEVFLIHINGRRASPREDGRTCSILLLRITEFAFEAKLRHESLSVSSRIQHSSSEEKFLR